MWRGRGILGGILGTASDYLSSTARGFYGIGYEGTETMALFVAIQITNGGGEHDARKRCGGTRIGPAGRRDL